MKLLVYGSKGFDDYSTFLRGIVVALEESMDSDDDRITIYAAGPFKINDFTEEFLKKTEGYFQQKKIRAKMIRVHRDSITDKFMSYNFGHVISFNGKNDPKKFDKIINVAKENNVPASIYRY